jgi:hypothetical protein
MEVGLQDSDGIIRSVQVPATDISGQVRHLVRVRDSRTYANCLQFLSRNTYNFVIVPTAPSDICINLM